MAVPAVTFRNALGRRGAAAAGPDGTGCAGGYFSYPGISVHAPSPGGYPGPFSAVSQSTAIYAGWCAACGNATAVPWDLATRGGAILCQEGDIACLTVATARASRGTVFRDSSRAAPAVRAR